ncbi:MAG: LITAF-like zinc ribbon domain-containing protein [Promethearchaeota archaeon]
MYCPTCEKEVTLRRKNFDHVYHEVLCFMVILTLGLGFLIYFILKYSKKPNTCPNCESEFDLNNLPTKTLNITPGFRSTSNLNFP